MEISFESKQLRELCENEDEGKRRLGDAVAKTLRDRLADCEAASSPKELIAGRSREGVDGTMVLDLEDGYSLTFAANHPTLPLTPSGEINWSKVHRIRILKIESDNASC